MTRGALLAILLVLALASAAQAAGPDRFVVMGDAHADFERRDRVRVSSRYLQLIEEANRLKPECVVIVGDMIHGFALGAELEEQWAAFDAATTEFQAPVYRAVGNHDVFNPKSEVFYQRRYGKLWYSADVGNCHLVVLDSEERRAPGRITGAQLAWLKNDLAAAKGKRLFVFVHQPLWEREEASFRASEWGREVHPLLVQAGVDTVFAGHKHRYEKNPTRDGVRYLVTGGAGCTLRDDSATGEFNHCLLVTVPGDGPATIEVVRAGRLESEEIVTTESWRQTNWFLGQFRTPPLVVEDQPVRRMLSFRVSNSFPQPVQGTVSFVGAGMLATPVTREFALPVRGTATLDFDTTVEPAELKGPVACRVQFTVADDAPCVSTQTCRIIPTVTAARSAVQVDGSLTEWNGAAPMVLNREDQLWSDPVQWPGPEVFSAQAWVGSDQQNLYLAVKVVDRIFTPTSPRAGSAKGDSVVLYLDGRAPVTVGQSTVTSGVGRIALAPGKEGEPVRVFFPGQGRVGYAGVRAASQRTADGYTLEVAVPLATFPNCGEVLGFDLSVNDNSDPKRPNVLFWQGDGNDWRDPSRFGRVRLGQEAGR